MFAHDFLSVMAATQPDPPDGLTRPTRIEIRRLFTAATAPLATTAHILDWSIWRRRHQARARDAHYHRQAAELT